MTLHITKDLVLLYALDTNRYSVTAGVDYNNNHLPNVLGKDREIGLKSAFLEGRISSEISLYKINQTNQTVTGAGFNPNGNFYSIPIGTTTNIGWDGDLEFSLVPGWQLIGTWYNGNVRNQTGSNQIAATYDNSWSLFSKYDFGKSARFGTSAIRGLAIGGGIFRLGSFWQGEYAASSLPPGTGRGQDARGRHEAIRN